VNQFVAAEWFYDRNRDFILAEARNEWAIDPYAWSEFISLTPIEDWLWGDIRNANVVMYPQYPEAGFFLDFANPVAKVAIECDGRAYHLDKEKDARRDAKLRASGWHVYRLTGSECRTEFDEETMEPGYARVFVEAIGQIHGLKREGCAKPKDGFSLAVSVLEMIVALNQEVAA
jgi:hypothetical protein